MVPARAAQSLISTRAGGQDDVSYTNSLKLQRRLSTRGPHSKQIDDFLTMGESQSKDIIDFLITGWPHCKEIIDVLPQEGPTVRTSQVALLQDGQQ